MRISLFLPLTPLFLFNVPAARPIHPHSCPMFPRAAALSQKVQLVAAVGIGGKQRLTAVIHTAPIDHTVGTAVADKEFCIRLERAVACAPHLVRVCWAQIFVLDTRPVVALDADGILQPIRLELQSDCVSHAGVSSTQGNGRFQAPGRAAPLSPASFRLFRESTGKHRNNTHPRRSTGSYSRRAPSPVGSCGAVPPWNMKRLHRQMQYTELLRVGAGCGFVAVEMHQPSAVSSCIRYTPGSTGEICSAWYITPVVISCAARGCTVSTTTNAFAALR